MKRRSFIAWLCCLPAMVQAQFATFHDRAFLAGRPIAAATLPQDDMESYTDLADLNALNGGTGWDGAYVARGGDIALRGVDDMETYTDSASLNGLNGGAGWNGAYVDR